MAKEHKATVTAEVKGTDKAAKDLGKMTAAEEKLAQKTKQAGQASAGAAKQTEKLSAAESDYIGLLTQINPALGGLVDGLLKGSKIAGDLASQNINLTGTFQKATAAIKANSAALKLIGAGGAVALAVFAIMKAIQGMRAEAERATAAIRQQVAALEDLEKARLASKGEAEKQAATRGEGPPTAMESTRIAAVKQRLDKSARFTDEQARAEAAILSSKGADDPERMKRLAILLDRFKGKDQIDVEQLKGAQPERRQAILDRLLSRRETDIDQVIRTEAQQVRETIKQALQETTRQGGTTVGIQEFIRSLPGAGFEGIDEKKLAEAVAALPGITQADRHRAGALSLGALGSLKAAGAQDVLSKNFASLQAVAAALEKEGVKDVTPELARQAELVLQFLTKAAERME